MNPEAIPTALYTMPIAGRLAMVLAVAHFPYARGEGMGKAFADMADAVTVRTAAILAVILVAPVGIISIGATLCGIVFGILFARYACRVLGGLTGDVYGATDMLAELAVLVAYFVMTGNTGNIDVAI